MDWQLQSDLQLDLKGDCIHHGVCIYTTAALLLRQPATNRGMPNPCCLKTAACTFRVQTRLNHTTDCTHEKRNRKNKDKTTHLQPA
jgi:hypothetical protein